MIILPSSVDKLRPNSSNRSYDPIFKIGFVGSVDKLRANLALNTVRNKSCGPNLLI